jgi:hypothetical protein
MGSCRRSTSGCLMTSSFAATVGGSISKGRALALALADHPEWLAEVDRDWSHLAIYYAQSTGGRGVVRSQPGFAIRGFAPATTLPTWRSGRGSAPALRMPVRRRRRGGLSEPGPLPGAAFTGRSRGAAGDPAGRRRQRHHHPYVLELPDGRGSGALRHGFVRPGARDRWPVHRRFLALCTTTGVNPQGVVMALMHRNALELLGAARRPMA